MRKNLNGSSENHVQVESTDKGITIVFPRETDVQPQRLALSGEKFLVLLVSCSPGIDLRLIIVFNRKRLPVDYRFTWISDYRWTIVSPGNDLRWIIVVPGCLITGELSFHPETTSGGLSFHPDLWLPVNYRFTRKQPPPVDYRFARISDYRLNFVLPGNVLCISRINITCFPLSAWTQSRVKRISTWSGRVRT